MNNEIQVLEIRAQRAYLDHAIEQMERHLRVADDEIADIIETGSYDAHFYWSENDISISAGRKQRLYEDFHYED